MGGSAEIVEFEKKSYMKIKKEEEKRKKQETELMKTEIGNRTKKQGLEVRKETENYPGAQP
jgi:hypothetical protein